MNRWTVNVEDFDKIEKDDVEGIVKNWQIREELRCI